MTTKIGTLTVTIKAELGTIYVDASNINDPLEDGSWEHPFDKIQEGIDAANSGDITIILEGTYAEGQINVNKENIKLIANGNVLVDGLRRQSVFAVTANYTTIEGFTIVNSGRGPPLIETYSGILLDNAYYCTIVDNNATNNNIGIQLIESSNNTITNNIISSNDRDGILVHDDSNGNTIIGNDVKQNHDGITISDSTGNILRNNVIYENTYNLDCPWPGASGVEVYQDIDDSNTVDGKPIYYLVGKEDFRIPENAGSVAAIDSRNITIRNLALSNNRVAIFLYNTNNSIIENTSIESCQYGIMLRLSEKNLIAYNNIVNNNWGIDFFGWCYNNFILANNIKNNIEGFIALSSSNNYIVHNNFIDNTEQVHELTCGTNIWDNGVEGNYWTDYVAKGGYDADGDGIGDIPYVINEDNQDNYPLMNPITTSTIYLYLIWKYFPNFIFDEQEQFYPCNFTYDDDNINDNPDDYNTSWPLACYVHTTECSWNDEDYLVVEYWLYYARDDKFWDRDLLGAHDHDWESVYIFLDQDDYSPAFVTYFQHFTYDTYEWDSSGFDKNENHLTTHVARDSHASYGSTFLGYGWFGLIPEPCDGGEKYDYDDFQIVYVDEIDPSWLELDFGKVEAPWTRERWDNPVEALEYINKDSYTLIGMEESGSKLYLHLYDNESRHIGKNYDTNGTEIEILGAYYEDIGNITIIMIPANLTEFMLVIDATYAHEDVEEYQITMRTVRDGKIVDEASMTNTIEKEEQQEFDAELDENGEIIVIPEFPTCIMLPLLMILTLFAFGLRKRYARYKS